MDNLFGTYLVSGVQKTSSWIYQLEIELENLKLKGQFCDNGETESSGTLVSCVFPFHAENALKHTVYGFISLCLNSIYVVFSA